jgi:arylsulfatase A-like enzyme
MPVLQMPNLDRLAREGMRFRNAYAGAPQCSPSRVCLQTGQSAPRSGFTVFMNSRDQTYYDQSKAYRGFPVVPCVSDMTIDPDRVTIPEALRPFGYACAHFGKWHMRGSPEQEGYVAHDGDTTNKEGNQDVPGDPKRMFSITERAIAFMEEQVEAKKPFYLQVSHYAMHAGHECLPETRQKYVDHPDVQAYCKTAEAAGRRHGDPATWLGMAHDLDGRMGAVLKRIEELGIDDDTYVIMTSDNGYRHKFLPGLAQPLHGGKWWVWQGGIRVPMIVRGPGIEPGSVFTENVVNYDFLPTFVEWAGGDPKSLKHTDGVSLAGLMRGDPPSQEFRGRRLYFHYPHYRTSMPHSAIVSERRKVMHFYERPDISMLFDLAGDEGEVENIAARHPEEHETLFGEMMRYFEQVGARMPKVNPEYSPEVYKQAKQYEQRMTWGPFEGRRSLDADESSNR